MKLDHRCLETSLYFFFIEVSLTYNIMLVAGIQHSDLISV